MAELSPWGDLSVHVLAWCQTVTPENGPWLRCDCDSIAVAHGKLEAHLNFVNSPATAACGLRLAAARIRTEPLPEHAKIRHVLKEKPRRELTLRT